MTDSEVQNGEGGAPPPEGRDETDGGLEERLSRLESIVTALDSDSIELEQALALFEEGVGHIRRAQEILSRAELKVEELIGREGDERRPLPPEDEAGHE